MLQFCYLSNLIIRDQTLRSATSFGKMLMFVLLVKTKTKTKKQKQKQKEKQKQKKTKHQVLSKYWIWGNFVYKIWHFFCNSWFWNFESKSSLSRSVIHHTSKIIQISLNSPHNKCCNHFDNFLSLMDLVNAMVLSCNFNHHLITPFSSLFSVTLITLIHA